MFERAIGMDLSDEINAGQKVVILYGPRQVGKTTLVKEVLSHSSKRFSRLTRMKKNIVICFPRETLPKYKGPFTGTRAYLSTRPNVFPRLGSI